MGLTITSGLTGYEAPNDFLARSSVLIPLLCTAFLFFFFSLLFWYILGVGTDRSFFIHR